MTHSSASANQSKPEPHPPGAADRGAATPGDTDRQSSGAAPGTGLDGDAAPGTSEELPVVQGLHVPDVPETEPRT